MMRRGGSTLGLALAFAGVSLATAGEDAKQTIEAGGIKFEAPVAWKSTPPASRMRLAQLSVKPIEGDDFPGELVVYAFPGGAGSVEDNIKRWEGQFRDKSDNVPKADVKKVKGKNVDITRVETSGKYHPAQFGLQREPDRESARLLGAIVVTDRVSYFLKMVGPDKTMLKIRPEFDALLTSLQVEEK
jgi:hypothetical protein